MKEKDIMFLLRSRVPNLLRERASRVSEIVTLICVGIHSCVCGGGGGLIGLNGWKCVEQVPLINQYFDALVLYVSHSANFNI